MSEKLFVVDLYSGSYNEKHELYNLKQNQDGMYYGYVPPHGYIESKLRDRNINVTKIDKNAKNFANNVLVIYVKAASDSNKKSDKEIIAFCESATVYKEPQSGKHLNRYDYQIKSDNLTEINENMPKHIIETGKYNSQIFRDQRSTLNEYPELKQGVIDYIKRIKKQIEEQNILDQDSVIEQENIQREYPASAEDSASYGCTPDEIVNTPLGKVIKKRASIAKKVIVDNNYKCSYDETHTTFLTSKGKPYMEGHHLIPCTVANSEDFKEQSKLDREENIVSICPNCHRAIHFGDDATKKQLIEKLYNKQEAKLKSVGFKIDLKIILSKYSLS